MAISLKKVDENEWKPYQPEYEGNRESGVKDPLILEIRYVSPQRMRMYFDDIKTKGRGKNIKIGKGETRRISKHVFVQNVRVVSGLFDTETKKVMKDIQWLWDAVTPELLDEIDEVVSNILTLEEGHPDNFK